MAWERTARKRRKPRRPIKKRSGVEPDFKYQSIVVAKFINNVMKDGKKSVAEKVMYDALNKVQEITKKEPLEILNLAINNAAPLLEIKSRRIGGATYQVPREVRGERKQALARKRLVELQRRKLQNQLLVRERKAGERLVVGAEEHSRLALGTVVPRNVPLNIGSILQRRSGRPRVVSVAVSKKSRSYRLRLVRPPVGFGTGSRKAQRSPIQETRNIGHPIRQPNLFVPRVVFPSGQPISRDQVVGRQKRVMVRPEKLKKVVGNRPPLRLISAPQTRFLRRNNVQPKPVPVRWQEMRAEQLGLRVITAPSQPVSGNVQRSALKKSRLRPRLRLAKPLQPAAKKPIVLERKRIVPATPIHGMARQVSRTQATIRRQMESERIRMVSIRRAQQAQERLKQSIQQLPKRPTPERMVVGLEKKSIPDTT